LTHNLTNDSILSLLHLDLLVYSPKLSTRLSQFHGPEMAHSWIPLRGEGSGVAWCSTVDGRPSAPGADDGVRSHDGLARIATTTGMEMAGSAATRRAEAQRASQLRQTNPQRR
jgi:hypothetical protein